MNNILQQLKNNNKDLPKSWNISVKITEKILNQKDQYTSMNKNYVELKKQYEIARKISNKHYAIKCVQENQQKIEELKKTQEDLKNQLQSQIIESKKLQKQIVDDKIMKCNLRKENKELRRKIKKLKQKKQDLNNNLESNNQKKENIDDQKYECELQLKYCANVMKMINNYKNTRLTVQFTQPNTQEKLNFPKAECNKRFSRPQMLIKPTFTNNQTRQRAKSFTSSFQRNNLELNTTNISSSSQIIDIKLISQKGCITSIKYSQTGRFYATGNENREFLLYETGQCIPFDSFNLDTSIISIDFNDEESLILVACYTKIYLFDLYYINGRYNVHQRPDNTRLGRIHHAEFVSSDQYIVCVEGMPIQLYKVCKKGPKCEGEFTCHNLSTPYWAMGTTLGGIVGGYYDGTIRIFEPCSCDAIFEKHVHESPICQILFKDSTVISLSKDGTVAFTDTISQEVEKRIALKECGIIHTKTRMTIFNDSLLVGGSNGLICEYDLNTGKFVKQWRKFHQTSITALDTSPFGVISADQNGIIKIW